MVNIYIWYLYMVYIIYIYRYLQDIHCYMVFTSEFGSASWQGIWSSMERRHFGTASSTNWSPSGVIQNIAGWEIHYNWVCKLNYCNGKIIKKRWFPIAMFEYQRIFISFALPYSLNPWQLWAGFQLIELWVKSALTIRAKRDAISCAARHRNSAQLGNSWSETPCPVDCVWILSQVESNQSQEYAHVEVLSSYSSGTFINIPHSKEKRSRGRWIFASIAVKAPGKVER